MYFTKSVLPPNALDAHSAETVFNEPAVGSLGLFTVLRSRVKTHEVVSVTPFWRIRNSGLSALMCRMSVYS